MRNVLPSFLRCEHVDVPIDQVITAHMGRAKVEQAYPPAPLLATGRIKRVADRRGANSLAPFWLLGRQIKRALVIEILTYGSNFAKKPCRDPCPYVIVKGLVSIIRFISVWGIGAAGLKDRMFFVQPLEPAWRVTSIEFDSSLSQVPFDRRST